jgi:hypothetical protein
MRIDVKETDTGVVIGTIEAPTLAIGQDWFRVVERLPYPSNLVHEFPALQTHVVRLASFGGKGRYDLCAIADDHAIKRWRAFTGFEDAVA